jgi:hypothetical protein
VGRRAGVSATQAILTSAPLRRRSQSTAGQVPISSFDLSDGKSTVTFSEVVSSLVIHSVGLLGIELDQDVSHPAGSKVSDHTPVLGRVGVGQSVSAITSKPLSHDAQTFAAPRTSTSSFGDGDRFGHCIVVQQQAA